ncbi:MAG: hypothetical protein R3324_15670 [Halobacteriales archaeon]|nr:hypothetical protein [Halobacteriales archaeon]
METREHYLSRREDLRRSLDVLTADVPDNYPDADEYGTNGPDALNIEVETVYRIVLGTGGPHDEVRVTVDRDGYVTGGTYAYYWAGQDGHGEVDLDRDEAQEWADAYGLGDYV